MNPAQTPLLINISRERRKMESGKWAVERSKRKEGRGERREERGRRKEERD
jgi:hypothetical protein